MYLYGLSSLVFWMLLVMAVFAVMRTGRPHGGRDRRDLADRGRA